MAKIPSVYGGSATSNSRALTENYQSMCGCSEEQIMTPINIPKSPTESSPLPGFRPPAQVDDLSDGTFDDKHVGPTNKELNPYFGLGVKTDFQIVVHNNSTDDLNIQRKEHKDLDSVRTMAFRGPMLLSGWGYDLCDQPILEDSDEKKNGDNGIDKEVATDRALWKTGPVDLKWDDERQVWSGGPQIVEGVTIESIKAASGSTSPKNFKISLRRGIDWENNKETVTCVNRDSSLERSNSGLFVMAIRINYEWRPFYVECEK